MTSRAMVSAAAAAFLLLAGCAAPVGEKPLFMPGASETGAPSASETGASGASETGAPGASETGASSPAPSKKSKSAQVKPPKVAGDPQARVQGDVIDTGLPAGDGDSYVIYGLTGSKQLMAEFGFAIGVRKSAKLVTADLVITEYEGSAAAKGFHPMQGQMELEHGVVQPAFGYYAGRAASISLTDVGRTVQAKVTPWSHDPEVTVFWFDPADVKDAANWSKLGAFDASGTRLPDGHIELFTF